VGFEQIFNGERRSAAPAPIFGKFGRIDMGVPIDNHIELLNLFKLFNRCASLS
jgi:hypothetical protein